MRKFACMLPGLLILLQAYGCSLFKQVAVSRQDSLQTTSQKASLDWKVDSTHLAKRVFTYTDSSGAQFDIEIVPSGPFSFSLKNGFAGSASMLRIHGKSQAGITAVDSSSESQPIRSIGSLKQHEKTRTEITQKQKTKSGSQWWMLALVVACLVVFVWSQLK